MAVEINFYFFRVSSKSRFLFGNSAAVRQWVFCISVFCQIAFRYMRLSFSSLHSVRSLSLRCFECFHLPFFFLCRVFLFGFSLPLTVFISDSFNLRGRNFLRLLLCAFCVLFPSVKPFCSRVSLSLWFVLDGLTSNVSNSSFCVILVCDSLSFPFFPVLWTVIVLFLVFRVIVFFFLFCGYLLGFEGVVRCFPILCDLGPRLLGFS